VRRVNRKNSKSPDTHVVFIVGIMVLTVFMAAILIFASGAEAHNDNVKTGEVKVTKYIYKVCDQRNLIYTYTSEGIAVSPNDPQCY
jgi:hypothetical protein